jgi:aryl-alcohol dehydrogenase-like predicted oxidoreductase
LEKFTAERLAVIRQPAAQPCYPFPIPGTTHIAHLEENVAAAGLSLTAKEIAELDVAA